MKMVDPKNYLLNPALILGLVILLLNDHCWKWTYANVLTGKLSDLAGLLVLPFLLSYLFPKYLKWHVIGTGLFFLWWKSPYAQGFIDGVNAYTPFFIGRVIDYTDYWTLLILPVVYVLLRKVASNQIQVFQLPFGLVLFPVCFALLATSQRRLPYHIELNGNLPLDFSSVKINQSREAILEKMDAYNWSVYRDTAVYIDRPPRRYLEADTIPDARWFYYRIDELVIEKDTIRALQFRITPHKAHQSNITLVNLDCPHTIDDRKTRGKWRRYYRKKLKTYFKEKLND